VGSGWSGAGTTAASRNSLRPGYQQDTGGGGVLENPAPKNSGPFVVENGAAAFIPKGFFPFEIPGAIRRGKFDVLESHPKNG
jgi:hypothetical protein